MSQRLSRHPWDPRGPGTSAEHEGEFKHLMTCIKTHVPIDLEALLALCRKQTPTDERKGKRLVQWGAFIKGSFGAASFLLAYWLFRPFVMLWFKGSLSAILMKSVLALSVTLLSVRLIKGRFRALAKRYPWLALNGVSEVRAMLLAHETRPSEALLELIEALNGDHKNALAALEEPRHARLRESLNGLALTRWDIIAELRASESVLPDAILSAYDKASIPLMLMALDLNGTWQNAKEGQEAIISDIETRTKEVREKIARLLRSHKTRRADASKRERGSSVFLQDALIDIMSESHQAQFEAGVLELDTLIEGDAELET